VPCSWHHASEDGLLTIWPAEYRTWAAGRGLLDRADIVSATAIASTRAAARGDVRSTRAAARGDVRQATTRRFEIATPPDGATYLIDPTLRMEFQSLPLHAVGAAGPVEWTINGRRLGQTSAEDELTWPLARGKHLVRARDARGQIAEAAILVK
jgi:membrane carboxypeptidase/penicillin-binding protein PbpC